MSTFDLIIQYAFSLAIFVFMFRLWMQYVRVDYYNPFTQTIIKITQPIVGPLRKVIPSIGKIDTATLLIIIILTFVKAYLRFNLFQINYFMLVPLAVLAIFGKLLFWVLIVRAIMSWVSRGANPIEIVLAQLSEPLITPIRRIIPPIGMIDISFMIFIFGLYLLNEFSLMIFGQYWAVAMILS